MKFIRKNGRVIPIREGGEARTKNDPRLKRRPHDTAEKLAVFGTFLGAYHGLATGAAKGVITHRVSAIVRPGVIAVQKRTLVYVPTVFRESIKKGVKQAAVGAIAGYGIGSIADHFRNSRKQKNA